MWRAPTPVTLFPVKFSFSSDKLSCNALFKLRSETISHRSPGQDIHNLCNQNQYIISSQKNYSFKLEIINTQIRKKCVWMHLSASPKAVDSNYIPCEGLKEFVNYAMNSLWVLWPWRGLPVDPVPDTASRSPGLWCVGWSKRRERHPGSRKSWCTWSFPLDHYPPRNLLRRKYRWNIAV